MNTALLYQCYVCRETLKEHEVEFAGTYKERPVFRRRCPNGHVDLCDDQGAVYPVDPWSYVDDP